MRILLITLLCLLIHSNSFGQSFLTSNVLPPCDGCNSPFPCGLDEPLSQNGVRKRFKYKDGMGKDYNGDGYTDQWLDIYIPTGPVPADGFPVLVYAHALGQTADDPCANADLLNRDDIVVILWESTTEDTRTSTGDIPPAALFYDSADEDFQRVLIWLRNSAESAASVNLDLNKVIVSGSSRGTRLSFKNLTNVQLPGGGGPLVNGALFTQAFPDTEWLIADTFNLTTPSELVQADYPPILMFFGKNPGVISDIHDPLRGMDVLEELQCQGVPSALVHSDNLTIFSEERRPMLLEFIQDPELFVTGLSSPIIEGDVLPLGPVLRPPKQVSLNLNPTDPQRFKLTWKQNLWSDIIENPNYLACEARLADPLTGDFCGSFHQDQVYVEMGEMINEIPTEFSLPSAYISACNLPGMLDAGAEYDVQVRCFIGIPGISMYSTATPWSNKVRIELPLCEEGRVAESARSSLIELEANKYLLSSTNADSKQYALYDLRGQVMKQGIFSDALQIDLNGRSKGIYILQFWNEASGMEQRQLLNY